jgi:hypothetical protein
MKETWPMRLFTDVFDLVLMAGFLGLGVGFVVVGVRLLRCGDEVTADGAVTWRQKLRKLRFDASPGINHDITDILVRAWRSLNGWLYLA